MHPKKRKATEAAVDGEESHVFKSQRFNGRAQAATAAASRPRRASTPAPKSTDAPKRRGRPPKASTAAVFTKSGPKTKLTSTTVVNNGAVKKRGRPPKAWTAAIPAKSERKAKLTSIPVVNNRAVTKRGRPPKASTAAVPAESKPKAKLNSIPVINNGTVKKRGRPSKAAATVTAPKKVKNAPKQAISTKATSGKARGQSSTKSILKNGDLRENVSIEENGAKPQNEADQNGADQNGADQNGADQNGADQNGADQNGADQNEADQNGADQNGVDQNGTDQNGEITDGVSAEEVDEKETENAPSYWLMKAEPETRMENGVDVKFSIDDLAAANEPQGWDGVRSHAAQRNMRAMKSGDLAFFYHSNCKVPGIAGILEIVQEHSVDESAFEENHPYYDAKSTRDNPKWSLVHVEFRHKLPQMITLTELKSFAKPGGALENMEMVKQSRLSVSRVSAKEWEFIMNLMENEDETADTAPIQPEGQAVEPEPDINPIDEELQEELQDEIREDDVANGEGVTDFW